MVHRCRLVSIFERVLGRKPNGCAPRLHHLPSALRSTSKYCHLATLYPTATKTLRHPLRQPLTGVARRFAYTSIPPINTSVLPQSTPILRPTYPHLPRVEIRPNVKLSFTIEDVTSSAPHPYQVHLRQILHSISTPISPSTYTLSRARDLQSLNTLRADVRVLVSQAKGYDARHFTLPNIHNDHRLQTCDGSLTAARLVIMLHWSSLHDDNLIFSSKAFTTTLLRQFGLLPAEESGYTQLAALNLFGVQSSPHWSTSSAIMCPEVDGVSKPYPEACLDRFRAHRVGMMLDSIIEGRGQMFALFGKSWTSQLVDEVMGQLDGSYTRLESKASLPMLSDWEMGIEGVGMSMIKQSLEGRRRVWADEHIIGHPSSYVGIEERLAHDGLDRPEVEIDFDLIVRHGAIKAVVLQLPHPSSCGYANSTHGHLTTQTLDIACHFLRNLLDGPPPSPTSLSQLAPLPSFPHSTIHAAVQLDDKLRGLIALQPASATYKLNLVERLRAEYDRLLDPQGDRLPFDLSTLPRCLRSDILEYGLHHLLPSTSPLPPPGEIPRIFLDALAAQYRKTKARTYAPCPTPPSTIALAPRAVPLPSSTASNIGSTRKATSTASKGSAKQSFTSNRAVDATRVPPKDTAESQSSGDERGGAGGAAGSGMFRRVARMMGLTR